MSVRNGHAEIPTLPMCHSGMELSNLPMPLNNLNSIIANESSSLEFAFSSLQAAVGGKGKLKTDFDKLAQEIQFFEGVYTIGDNLKTLLALLGGDTSKLIAEVKKQPAISNINLQLGFLENSIIATLKSYEQNELKGYISVALKNPGTHYGANGAINGANVTLSLDTSLILKYEVLLVT